MTIRAHRAKTGEVFLRSLVVLMTGLLAVSCSSRSSDPAASRKLTLGYIPGAQDFIVSVMDSRKLFERHRLEVTKTRILSPSTLHLMIAEGKVDIGFGGVTTMATARAQGKPVIVVHGIFSPVNVVFVPLTSPIRTLADLRGKKLGDFGGPGSSTLAFLAVVAKQWYGLDLFRDVQLVAAPGPVLSTLLDSGQIDAALMGTTESINFSADGRYRALLDLSDEYKQRNMVAPAHVAIATNEPFASAHRDLVTGFVQAYRDAVQFAREDQGVWTAYGKSVGIQSEAGIATLRAKMMPNLVERWDAEQIAAERQFLVFAHSVLGEQVFKTYPEGLIRDDFNP